MMHSLRASRSSFMLKVTVKDLAKLLADENTKSAGAEEHEKDADDDGWHRVESGTANCSITATDALMLVRVRDATAEELLDVCREYTTTAAARDVLQRAAKEKLHTHEHEEEVDPWCWQSLWRETTRLWRTTAATNPPPCVVS